MRIAYRTLLVIIAISSMLGAQYQVRYYRNHADFVRGLDSDPRQLPGLACFKVQYNGRQILSIAELDSSGQPLFREVFEYAPAGSLQRKRKLDRQGKTVQLINYENDPLIAELIIRIEGRAWQPLHAGSYTTTHYDSVGNPRVIDMVDSDGSLIGGVRYHYNRNSELIKELWLDQNGRTLGYSVFEYDRNDSVQTIRQYNQRDSLISSIRLKILTPYLSRE